MDKADHSGEARERSRSRRFWTIMGAIAGAGFVPGLYMGYTGSGAIDSGAAWPAPAVIIIAIVYVLAVTIGSLLLRRHVDELAMHNRLRAIAFAAGVYFLVYPVWWLLWMGALVPEPSHWQLFILFYFSFVGGCIWYARNAI